MKTKALISFAVTAKLICACVFAMQIFGYLTPCRGSNEGVLFGQYSLGDHAQSFVDLGGAGQISSSMFQKLAKQGTQ